MNNSSVSFWVTFFLFVKMGIVLMLSFVLFTLIFNPQSVGHWFGVLYHSILEGMK